MKKLALCVVEWMIEQECQESILVPCVLLSVKIIVVAGVICLAWNLMLLRHVVFKIWLWLCVMMIVLAARDKMSKDDEHVGFVAESRQVVGPVAKELDGDRKTTNYADRPLSLAGLHARRER